MRKYILILFSIVIVTALLKIVLLPSSDRKTSIKIELIKNELRKNGYYPSWIIISKKRSVLYNSMLSNSSKDSYHLKGKAIDIFVFDINNDGVFNTEDIVLIREANKEVEKLHPGLVGAVVTYTTKGWPTNKMVHIDTRGYSKYYNY
jgi:uncharacterized protein YcbK (DUF882 family)